MNLDNYEEDLKIVDKLEDRNPNAALLILLDYKEYFDNTFDPDFDIYLESPIHKDIIKIVDEKLLKKNQMYMDASYYYYELAFIYHYHLKDYTKAEIYYNRANSLSPFNTYNLADLAYTKIKIGKLDGVPKLLTAAVASSKNFNEIAYAYKFYVHYFACIDNKEALLVCEILTDLYGPQDYKKNWIKSLLGTDTIDQKYYSYDYYGPLAKKYDIQVGFSEELIELAKNCLYSTQQDNDLNAKKYYLDILSDMEPDYIDAYNKLNKGEDVTLDLGECEYVETSYRDFYPLVPKKKKYITRDE